MVLWEKRENTRLQKAEGRINVSRWGNRVGM